MSVKLTDSGNGLIATMQPTNFIPKIYTTTASLLADQSSGLLGDGVYQVGGKMYTCSSGVLYGTDGRLLLRNIADRCSLNNTFNSGVKQIMSRSTHINKSDLSHSYLKILLTNYQSDETATGSASSVTASIEYPSGTYTQLKFSGAATGSIPNGGSLESDFTALTTAIPPKARFWVRIWESNASGCLYQDRGQGADDGLNYSGTTTADLTMGGGNPGGLPGVSHRPIAIVGASNLPSVLGLGDSRVNGTGEVNVNMIPAYTGYVERGLSPYFSFQRVGAPSETLAHYLGANAQRSKAIAYATHIVCDYGINDLTGGRTTAQLKTDTATLHGLYTQPIYHTTLEPITTSSDGWLTTANQTLSARDAQRTAFNDWLRSQQADSVAGVFDVCSVLESSLNSGKWVVDGCTFTGVVAASVLTASAVTGTIKLGHRLSGTGITNDTQIIAFGTGTGGAGTYTVTATTTASSTTINAAYVDYLGVHASMLGNIVASAVFNPGAIR